MTQAFDRFCADCSQALKADPGPAGREAVRQNLEKLLDDPDCAGVKLTKPSTKPVTASIDRPRYRRAIHAS